MTITVIGLGYVGLPLAIELAKAGSKVYGYDISQKVVDNILNAKDITFDISIEDLKNVIDDGSFTPSTDANKIADSNVSIICVPTPLDSAKQPNLSYVRDASQQIADNFSKGHLVVMESTTYPGTTDEVIKPILESSGLKAGLDFHLAFSPERIDPGNKEFQVANTPKIVGGIDEASTKAAASLYRTFLENVHEVSSTRAAEMVKLLENTFRVVNIAMVDELAMLCDRMDIDIWEVIDAAKTKPYGFMPFYPGPGVGGHCIPIDPFYLSWKAKEFDFNTRFIEMAGEMNDNMPYWTVDKLMKIMNRNKILMNGSQIVLLGLAYKKNIADYRESATFQIKHLLEQHGATVKVCDPYIETAQEHGNTVNTVKLSAELLSNSDATVILTDHDDFDTKLIVRSSKLVFDTRNLIKSRDNSHVYHL
ncbi:MAG: nucleotide sugar dehydrogenase [Candidatus Kapaibacteriales bacterium]